MQGGKNQDAKRDRWVIGKVRRDRAIQTL